MKALGLVLVTIVAAGCAVPDWSASNSPEGQSASTSGGGSFSFAANQGLSGASDAKSFENQGTAAKGSYSVNLGAGSLTLSVQDGEGNTVWTFTRSTPGQAAASFTTSSGEPGTWKATVKMAAFSGQYAFEGRAT